MFDTFCVILLVAQGYTMECIPLKKEYDFYEHCDIVVRYYKHVQMHRDFDGQWFGHYCTTQEEVLSWNLKNQD